MGGQAGRRPKAHALHTAYQHEAWRDATWKRFQRQLLLIYSWAINCEKAK